MHLFVKTFFGVLSQTRKQLNKMTSGIIENNLTTITCSLTNDPKINTAKLSKFSLLHYAQPLHWPSNVT